jgi:hypothetical protein
MGELADYPVGHASLLLRSAQPRTSGFELIGAAETRFGPAVRMRREVHR